MRDRHDHAPGDFRRGMGLVAEPLVGHAPRPRSFGRPRSDRVRPDADQRYRAPLGQRRLQSRGDLVLGIVEAPRLPAIAKRMRPLARLRPGLQHVHRRLADEGADEQIGRPLLAGRAACAICCSTPSFHHGDAVGEGALASVWSWVTSTEVMLRSRQIVLQAAAQDRAQLRLQLSPWVRRAGRDRPRAPEREPGWRAAAGRRRSTSG